MFDSATYWNPIKPLTELEKNSFFFQNSEVLAGFANFLTLSVNGLSLPEGTVEPILNDLEEVNQWFSNISKMRRTLNDYEEEFKESDYAFFDFFTLMDLLKSENVLRIYYQASMALQAINFRNTYPEQWLDYRIFQTYFYDIIQQGLPSIYKNLLENEDLFKELWVQLHPPLNNKHTPPSIREFWNAR